VETCNKYPIKSLCAEILYPISHQYFVQRKGFIKQPFISLSRHLFEIIHEKFAKKLWKLETNKYSIESVYKKCVILSGIIVLY